MHFKYVELTVWFISQLFIRNIEYSFVLLKFFFNFAIKLPKKQATNYQTIININ